MATQALEPTQPAVPRGRDAIREEIRLRDSNINAQTLLATDYLNHFNEIIMMIELAADMPEMFELTASWEPLGYEEHFLRSNFSDRQLAVEAFLYSPADVRHRFDATIRALDDLLVSGVSAAQAVLDAELEGAFNTTCRDLAHDARSHVDVLSAIIHGRHTEVSDKSHLDSETLEEAQQTIDCLFST
jgi:hypothetical protein